MLSVSPLSMPSDPSRAPSLPSPQAGEGRGGGDLSRKGRGEGAAADCLARAGAAGFAVLLFVTLVRPSTPTGASPMMVERRTTRLSSP